MGAVCFVSVTVAVAEGFVVVLLCALSVKNILLISITISVLFFIFYVFANGAVRSPSTFLYLWGYDGIGVAASCDCGSIFIGGWK